jgi:shikimate O-hydroxycinnamoyltransferase
MQVLLVKALKHQQQSIKCSLSDHFVFRVPVPVVFFYRESIESDLIVDALQKALQDFPIFAGILVKRSHQLYIDCNNHGAQVKITRSETSLFKILSNLTHLKKSEFVDLINPSKTLKKRTPLLTIKISYYADGMALGYCWHHSVGDMSTFMEFLKAVSACAQGRGYQKSLIVDDRETYLNHWVKNNIQITNKNQPSDLKYLTYSDIFHLVKQVFLPKRTIYFYFNNDEIVNMRDTLSSKAGCKLSRNDVICAHLLSILSSCREDNAAKHNTSIIVNVRPRIGMLANVLGNYLGTASINFLKSNKIETIATDINLSVKNFLHDNFRFNEAQEFVEQCGGLKKLNRIIPEAILPKNKNLIISNWSNFGVYSIDFGISAPYLFLPVGETLLPWVSCIVEGFDDEGFLITMVIPYKVAKKLEDPSMQAHIHSYRKTNPTKASFPAGIL